MEQGERHRPVGEVQHLPSVAEGHPQVVQLKNTFHITIKVQKYSNKFFNLMGTIKLLRQHDIR